MRRREREVSGREEILAILGQAQFADLAFICEGRPVVVPLSFGFREEEGAVVFYFHSAQEGSKIDALKLDPRVSLAAVGANRIQLGTPACKSTCFYESVTAEGTVEFLEEPAARRDALDCLMRRYGMEAPEYGEALLARTAVYRLRAAKVTGKSNIPE